jgi:nitroreductase
VEKPATTSLPIHELIGRRWSPRAFDPVRPVTRDQLVTMLEAARWAPSCSGDEPWRFLVWNRLHDAASWQRAFDCLDKGNQEWVILAPILMCSFADAVFSFNQKPNRWAPHDVGLATQNLLLQATALGLWAHPMGGFDAAKVKAGFEVPEPFTPMAMIAIGYAGDPQLLSEKKRAQELGPRKRKPLAEKFFAASWGAGIETTNS